MSVLSVLVILLLVLSGCSPSVWYLWYLVAVPPTYLTPGIWGRGADQDCKRPAGSVGLECMVRPPKMAALLVSVHPLPDQCLLHLHPIHIPDLLKYCPHPS